MLLLQSYHVISCFVVLFWLWCHFLSLLSYRKSTKAKSWFTLKFSKVSHHKYLPMVAICVILVWLLAANSDDVDLEVK